MSCEDRQIQISRFLRGDLSDPEIEPLLKHLEKCEECRIAEREFKSVERFLSGSGDPVVPPFLNQRIVARITEEMAADANAGILSGLFRPFLALKPMRAAGVMAAALFLGVLTGANLLSSFNDVRRHPQSDVIALAFGPNLEFASLEAVYLDDQGTP